MALHEKVKTWLLANPGKRLNADTIADYFQVNRAKVATELSKAVRSGDLKMQTHSGEDGEPQWFLPDSAASALAVSFPVNALSMPATRAAKTAAQLSHALATKPRYTPRDFDNVKIEDGVPMDCVPQRGEAQYQKIVNIFERMKPTQSVVLPDCNALRAALAKFNRVEGQQMSRRTLPDKESVRVCASANQLSPRSRKRSISPAASAAGGFSKAHRWALEKQNPHYHESPIMIRITDPQGPDAARSMVSGMLAVAELNDYGPDVILSATCSVLVVMARQLPSSREAISNAVRGVLQIIESGEFPTSDQAIGQQPAAGEKLH